MITFEKVGQRQPLNRQAERYAPAGMKLSLSTLADQVGACTVALMPLFKRLPDHVMAAGRLYGDDTTVPVLARGKTHIARSWVYMRDDRPFGGTVARDRDGQHPQAHLATYTGILQANAYGGYGKLYAANRSPGLVLEAGCWAHARRKSQGKQPAAILPLCLEVVTRIDALFGIERDINECSADQGCARRQPLSTSLVADLHTWMREHHGKLSGVNDVARAMDYMLKR